MHGRLRNYEPLLMTLHRIVDALLGAGLFLLLATHLNAFTEMYLTSAILIFFMTLVCFNLVGLYRSWRTASVGFELQHIVLGCFVLYILFLFVCYVLKISTHFSRSAVLTWMVTWPAVMALERLAIRAVFRYFRAKGRNYRTAIIAGAGEMGVRLARNCR